MNPLNQAITLLRSGADKIAVNSSVIERPSFVSELTNRLGTQCVVVSIQAKKIDDHRWLAFKEGGRENTGLDVIDWAMQIQDLGAGEILVTSIDKDGTRKGFDKDLMREISKRVKIPVIASGGLGTPHHAGSLFNETNCEAVAVADYLHTGRGEIHEIKADVKKYNFDVRDNNYL